MVGDIQVPGDFLGLRSLLFRTSDHNIEPITRVEASVVLAYQYYLSQQEPDGVQINLGEGGVSIITK